MWCGWVCACMQVCMCVSIRGRERREGVAKPFYVHVQVQMLHNPTLHHVVHTYVHPRVMQAVYTNVSSDQPSSLHIPLPQNGTNETWASTQQSFKLLTIVIEPVHEYIHIPFPKKIWTEKWYIAPCCCTYACTSNINTTSQSWVGAISIGTLWDRELQSSIWSPPPQKRDRAQCNRML